jgi:hypothetical protein
VNPTTRHFSEADLLETYYLQPGQSMPVMMHLAGCSDCAARYERLERKLREAASCHTTEHPPTFWARQRLTVMRSIAAQRTRSASAIRTWRAAAAVTLAFLLGGAVVYETRDNSPKPPPPTLTATASHAPAAMPDLRDDNLLAHDAWQSEELQQFHSVVQWETWVGDGKPQQGDQSL